MQSGLSYGLNYKITNSLVNDEIFYCGHCPENSLKPAVLTYFVEVARL